MEALHFDLKPFGISTTIVEPGFFRTELMSDASIRWADLSIEDYAERTAATKSEWESVSGNQPGDPVKLAEPLIAVAELDNPPVRFAAGSDAIPAIAGKGRQITEQAEASRKLGFDLGFDE